MENARPEGAVALLIDVDGTLVDSTYLHAVSWAGALRSAGFDIPTSRIHRLIGMRGERLLTELLGADTAQEVAKPVEADHASRFRAVRGQVVELPGARRLLEAAHERGVPAVLTSSAHSDEIEHYLELLDARDLVAAWTSASDVRRSKPDPEPISLALRRSGCERGAVIGDSTWDCLAADAAGLPSIAVMTGGFAVTELEQAGAALVCEGPLEISERLGTVLEFAASGRRARS
jgi:phosphoglycolate phosphatase-like HAD superfamily hydrolase